MSIQANFPAIKPTLLLDFANTEALDPRITFTRASTGTYYDAFGVLQTAAAGAPRFDHNPVTGESLGLLIEEQRTNLVTYSEQFDNAAWQKQNVTVAANTTVAPDGTLTADTLTPAAANSFAYQVFSAAAATYTFSIWIKAASVGTSLELNLYTNTGASSVAAAVVTTTGSWQRVSVTGTYASASASAWATIGGNASFSTGETLYIWGAQLEAGAFPTSYIPTVGSQVTRAADAASMTGTNFSSWYRQDQGTLFGEAFSANNITNANDGTAKGIANISDGTNNNNISIAWQGTKYFVNTNNSTIILNSVGTLTANASFKFVGSYESGINYSFARNGVLGTSVTSGLAPVVNQLNIGRCLPNNGIFSGTITRIAYYPARVTNAQLQALTS